MHTRVLWLAGACTGLLTFPAACQLNDTDSAPPAPDLPYDEETSPVQVGTPVAARRVGAQDRSDGDQCPPSDAAAPDSRDASSPVGFDAGVPQLVDAGFPQPVDGGFPTAIDAGFLPVSDGGFTAPPEAGVAPLFDAAFPQLPTFDASLPPGNVGGGADAGRR